MNNTPYTDEQWKKWYAHKSNKEAFIEQEERDLETAIYDAEEAQIHNHMGGQR